MNIGEKELQRLNEGKMADLAYSVIKPVMAEMKEDALANMKMAYMDPKTDDRAIVRICAEIAAIDRLIEKLEMKIRVGRKIAEKLIEDDDGN